jgi:hypothetical protein
MNVNNQRNSNNINKMDGSINSNTMGTNFGVNTGIANQMQNNMFGNIGQFNPQINSQTQGFGSHQNLNGFNNNNMNLIAQMLNSRTIANRQQNVPSVGAINFPQALTNNMRQNNSPPPMNRINIKVTKKKHSLPLPSLINKRVNGFSKHAVKTNTFSKTPIITMVPKRQMNSNLAKQIMERKRLTMLEKLRAIPPISLSAMKAAASKTLQNAVTDRRIGSSKGISEKLDSTNKIKVISKNNTAEVKIINDKPVSVGTGTNDPNIIVLKDISITNTSVEGVNGTVNGTKMSITLMSQATGGRSIVIEANHNIVLSQEKMPNGTVQFIIKTDTKSTTPETTTPVSTTVPTEEPELDGEETTTTPIPTTTAEV